MMDKNDQPDVALSCGATVEPSTGDSHNGLVLASAVMATIVMLVAGIYAYRTELILVKALALQATLASLGSFLCLHACRIRRNVERDESSEKKSGSVVSRLCHAHMLHTVFIATPFVVLVAVLSLSTLWNQSGKLIADGQAITFGVLCLAASCMWVVLARSFDAVKEEELPEQEGLKLLFRESHWVCVFVATGAILGMIWPGAQVWAGRIILAWLLIVCCEQLARLAITWWKSSEEDTFVSPLRLVAREAIFVRGNPIASMFETIERRFGVSFRSSWAINFVRRATVPAILMVLLILWLLSSVVIVDLNKMGIEERFGQAVGEPLAPGMHLKLPWPFGRVRQFAVKSVSTVPIGFVLKEGSEWQKALLWNKTHGGEEFALVLGNGNELVAINALIYYKILEEKAGFFNYVYQTQNPDEALEAYAYRTLMEWTRSATLEQVLSANRAEFARRLKETIRKYASENRLGIEVVEVALISLHPPIEVSSSYLDVISANIDAHRAQVEERGRKETRILQAKSQGHAMVADAKINAARRIGVAQKEALQFTAIGEGFNKSPDAFSLKLWFETLEEALGEKEITIIDKVFTTGAGEILLDMRGGRSGDLYGSEGDE